MNAREIKFEPGQFAEALFECEVDDTLHDFCKDSEHSDRVILYVIKDENLEPVAYEVHTPHCVYRDKDKFRAICMALVHQSTQTLTFEKNFAELREATSSEDEEGIAG